ncbi:hypothetical protein G3M48_006221 [Beauveria asiatica]|uniref:ABC transporter n=1 Tax=Beauveria asiatica TaxID=1069075 RepID=A0AAW0S6A9_9HYPO
MPLRESAKKSYAYPVLIRCCMQIGILALEYCDAQLAAGSPSKLCVAEDEHNIIHRLFLTWINPILLHGYSNILGQEDLPPLCADMHAERTRRLMLKAWRKRAIPDTKAKHEKQANPILAVRIRRLRFGQTRIILNDVNLDIARGSLNILSGATGSGKSMLLRAILGEVPVPKGTLDISPRSHRMAYCSQKPWLPSGSVKEVIWGHLFSSSSVTHQDEERYREVTRLCCLDHDFLALPFGDQTQIGSQGLNLSGGQRQRVALARALFAECDLILLDDTFSGLDGDTEDKIFKNLFGPGGALKQSGVTVILASNSTQFFSHAEHIVVLGNHGVIEQGPWSSIKIKAESIAKFSSVTNATGSSPLAANFNSLNAQLRIKDEDEVDLARQTGDTALYHYYLGFIDRFDFIFLNVDTFIYAFFITIPQWWLKLWTEAAGNSNSFYLLGFLVVSFLSWALTSAQMWSVLIRIAPQSGSRLHSRLLRIISNAPLSYFSKTDNGSSLNRFSQDVQLIDKQLPSAMQTVITQFSKLLMQAIVLCMAELRLSISLPLCIAIVLVIQKLYLRTSRQLRFLELESRAQVFSNFLESIEGLETIRAFNWSNAMARANIDCVERSQRPELLLMSLQRWLNLVLDLLVAAIAVGVVALAVQFRASITGAQVGIALSIMLVANKTLLKLVDSWTTMETSLGAISRVKTLEEMTPLEDWLSGDLQPINWPSQGRIEFTGVNASYNSESLALRNIDLRILAGQKVVVCGRTGRYVMNFLLLNYLALLRLLELQSGQIRLDGIDIRHVSLQSLRQVCFITASQDALVLANESLRFNLDPDNSASEGSLILALEKSGLWSHFNPAVISARDGSVATEEPGDQNGRILDQKVSEFPLLSGGQFQLFSLSRALVKLESSRQLGLKPVVLLDELTSSLDTTTELAIHRVIDEEFTANGNTIIMVTHRLGNLEKYMQRGRDVFVLLQDGRLTEVIRDWGSTTLQKIESLP